MRFLLAISIFALYFCAVTTDNDNESDEKLYIKSLGEYEKFRESSVKRSAKFLHFRSYPQSPIVDMMMQSAAPNYSPRYPGDPFDFLRDDYPLPKGYTSPLAEYDYVVIGASAAGSALASRLTEDKPRSTVLLLEAGRPEMLLTDVPALAPYWSRTDYTYSYLMEKQPGICLGLEKQRCPVSRGKAVGGSTVTDHMIYSRGRPEDWDRVAADGNNGWTYNDVLKYFLKLENVELDRIKNPVESNDRGRNGKLSIRNVPFRTGLVEAFLAAGRENGQQTVDYNSPGSTGFGYVQTIMTNGHRQSAAKAYLHPHKRRRNLHILTESKAVKILIDSQNKAYGVEYVRNRLKYVVRARREVILSAGPIASPQLLMLSGVGPQEHLQSLNIPVVKNLNVGTNLYDHIGFPGIVFKLNTTNASIIEDKAATIPNLIQWIQFGEGLLTNPGLVEGIGHLKTSHSLETETANVELISLAGSIVSDSGGAMRHGMRIIDEIYHNAFGSINNKDTYSIIPVLLQPKSKGYLQLRDQNPYNPPKIIGNYLTAQSDIDTLISAIRYIIQLVESKSFNKYSPRLHQADYIPCRQYPYGSNDYWECAIRTVTVSYQDIIGTCKMGPANDPDAVVNSELKVHGIEGLRVVDSCIIPRSLSGHTNGIGIMIGEKASDLIKSTWSNAV